MPLRTKYIHTLQRILEMIEKNQLSWHIIFDNFVNSPQAIRIRRYGQEKKSVNTWIIRYADMLYCGRSL